MNPALLIVGGGPAGAAAAITLARAGERPLLIERTRETERAGRGKGASARRPPANNLTRVVGAGLSASASTPIPASVSSVRQLRNPPQIASPVSRLRSSNSGYSPARASVIAAAAPAGPPPTINSGAFTP